MKAYELMIGDWVHVKAIRSPFQITRDFIGKINEVDGLNCMVGIDKSSFYYDELESIPLTPEILEKNGFKYSNWYGWQIKEPDFTLCFVGDTPHFLLDDIFVCDCPYVHTLQHILKLCGIDKEIVL